MNPSDCSCPCFEKVSRRGDYWRPCSPPPSVNEQAENRLIGIVMGSVFAGIFLVIGLIICGTLIWLWWQDRKRTLAAHAAAPEPEEQAAPRISMSDTCSICLTELRFGADVGALRALQCAHVFHESCISAWLLRERTCPLCRQPQPRRLLRETDAEAQARRDAEEAARAAQADEDDSSWSSEAESSESSSSSSPPPPSRRRRRSPPSGSGGIRRPHRFRSGRV
jgi:hypothetical protein